MRIRIGIRSRWGSCSKGLLEECVGMEKVRVRVSTREYADRNAPQLGRYPNANTETETEMWMRIGKNDGGGNVNVNVNANVNIGPTTRHPTTRTPPPPIRTHHPTAIAAATATPPPTTPPQPPPAAPNSATPPAPTPSCPRPRITDQPSSTGSLTIQLHRHRRLGYGDRGR
ncbi:uncharacterized protein EV422DRAFT_523566 [Fimicolochytrium jonesii]|uniref:uncharacterized protein n=1 Tax=Fimicolochytrium jonesii TaxID=1396493 RepID=UPI0022FDEB14|nr:uncharacterized protein EV422DRAFT_523566 [Fimicolochytrium jonesii]KAI8823154.1 hypothetical protein EV422DRAFT_523566 [Fimicolochytrium jonesii]